MWGGSTLTRRCAATSPAHGRGKGAFWVPMDGVAETVRVQRLGIRIRVRNGTSSGATSSGDLKRGNARQRLALHPLQESPASGRHVAQLVQHAGMVQRGDGVAAACNAA